MTFKITDTAFSDIDEITNYIANKNKKAAINLLELFYESFQALQENPKIGNTRYDLTDKKVFFWVVKKKYLVIYKIEDNNIIILRVLSTYRDIIKIL